MKHLKYIVITLSLLFCMSACLPVRKTAGFEGKPGEVKLMILDPGHFHADLLLKKGNDRINKDVFVYAPQGVGLNQHLERVKSFNARDVNPTGWHPIVYDSADFLTQMLKKTGGNVVVLAGNNQKKTDYVFQSVSSGIHVLADKPLAITPDKFELLKQSVKEAAKNKVMIYDMMTERFAILNIIQRAIMSNESLFGRLEAGDQENPAVRMESVHHFYKNVAGMPLIRPAWYYDVKQQGEGLVDVTTHMIDLVHWICFPEVVLNYKKDLAVLRASHWPTKISPEQFSRSTHQAAFPEYLQAAVKNNYLEVFSNGEMLYQVKGTFVNLRVRWDYEAPKGAGDTHSSIIRGTRAVVEIIQNASTGFTPELYICPVDKADSGFNDALRAFVGELHKLYPEISISEQQGKFQIVVPQIYREGHETHFAKVAETFFGYLKEGKMPDWEIPNLLAKYFITTTAYEMANTKKLY